MDSILDERVGDGVVSGRDRYLIQEMIYGAVRHRNSIDFILDHYIQFSMRRHDVAIRWGLRLAAYQIIYLSRIPPHAAIHGTLEAMKAYGGLQRRDIGFANAVLRRLQNDIQEKAEDPVEDESDRRILPARHGWCRFSHPVLQEVLYDALAPDLRRAMHRQLATHLERRGDGVDPSRLGNHWEYAGERDRALPHLLSAARRATEHHSYLSALDLSERAGLRPDSIDEERAHKHSELLLALTSCYRHLARHDEAGRILDAVERSAEHHHEWRLALRARVRRAQVRSSLRAQSTLDLDLDLLRRAAQVLPTCSEREIAKNLLADREHAASQ